MKKMFLILLFIFIFSNASGQYRLPVTIIHSENTEIPIYNYGVLDSIPDYVVLDSISDYVVLDSISDSVGIGISTPNHKLYNNGSVLVGDTIFVSTVDDSTKIYPANDTIYFCSDNFNFVMFENGKFCFYGNNIRVNIKGYNFLERLRKQSGVKK